MMIEEDNNCLVQLNKHISAAVCKHTTIQEFFIKIITEEDRHCLIQFSKHVSAAVCKHTTIREFS
jgi:hypothetical protein